MRIAERRRLSRPSSGTPLGFTLRMPIVADFDRRATVTLGARRRPAPGVYFVHAAQGMRTDSRAVVIVR